MKVAALDLGTNSFLCLIAVVESGRVLNVLSDQVQVVRLGQDMQKTGAFHPEALARARTCLTNFKKTIEEHHPDAVLAMATSAARDASNRHELFELGSSLGIPIEIIPGDREAEMTFKGSISGFPKDQKRRAVIDIGGGSTEIIAGNHEKILGGRSVDIGAVRLTEMFFAIQPPTSHQLSECKKKIETELAALLESIKRFDVDELVAVAGTPTELAAATLGGFDPAKIEGFRFSDTALRNWVERLSQMAPEDRAQKLGISRGRADIILAGALELSLILEGLDFQSLTVSTRGVRFGVALEAERRFRT